MVLAEALSRYPRTRLTEGPTPLQRLRRVEAALGSALNGVQLYGKRDDLMGLGGGGSKLRKLEMLLGDAAAKGADVIVATGGRQSNSLRLTAAACAREGLACELVLAPAAPDADGDFRENGNALLDPLFGATVHQVPAGMGAAEFARTRIDALSAQGRTPYLTPAGASSSLSALGYARCALELDAQLAELGLDEPVIVTANGSFGTQAGLLAGFRILDRPQRIHGFTILAAADDCRQGTQAMANDALALLDSPTRLGPDEVQIFEEQRGEGYGRVTAEALAAIRLMASHEGLLLDPVYSGKAFAGVLDHARTGRYRPGAAVVFLMTGGSPALFAYRQALAPQPV